MFTPQGYVSALRAFQKSPDYRNRKTVRVLIDVLFRKFISLDDILGSEKEVASTVIDRFCLGYEYVPGSPGPVAYLTSIMRSTSQEIATSHVVEPKTANSDFSSLVSASGGTLIVY